MRGEIIRKAMGVVLLVFVASLGFSGGVKEWVNIPTSMVLFEGDDSPLREATQSLQAMTVSSGNSDQAAAKGNKETVALEVA